MTIEKLPVSEEIQPDEYSVLLDCPLEVLSPHQIVQIDRALAKLGPFSEVRLIKNRGKLRFIQMVESEELAAPR